MINTYDSSVYTVSDKHLRHGGSGYETTFVARTRDNILSLLGPARSLLGPQRRTQDLGGGGARSWAGPQTLTARGYGGAL